MGAVDTSQDFVSPFQGVGFVYVEVGIVGGIILSYLLFNGAL